MSSACSSSEVEPSQASLNLRKGNRTRSRSNSPAGEKVKRLEDDPVWELDLEKVTRDLSSPVDPRSQQSKLVVPGEIVKRGVVKKRRNNTKPPAEQYSIDSGKEDEVCKLKNELSTAMQQNQRVVAQGSNLRSQAGNVIGTLGSELKHELLASRMTREQDADVVRKLAFRNEAAEEPQQQLIAQMRIAAEQRFACQAEEHSVEIEKLNVAAAHGKEMTVAMLENQARLSYTQSKGQNRMNLTEAEQSLADRSESAVASLNRLHSEEFDKVVADYKRQLAAMDDDAREKGRQHGLQVAEYKRKIDLANNAVGDGLAEKMSLMQEEHANELRSMMEQTNATMHDVIRDNASMDAEHQEKQRMQTYFAQVSRNAHEGKQIAIARINTKLHLRDNEIFALQEVRDKYDKMMRECPVFQQSSELVTSPVGRPVGFPSVGAHFVGINRFKKPPNCSDLDPPASDSGPSEGRRRWGGPPEGPDPDPQDPPGRPPDRSTSLSLRCHLRQDFTYGDRQ